MVLRGRAEEQAALDALLADACDGRSGALVVRGEPGIGKTALLEYAADRARRAHGMSVVQATGVETEAEIAFASLHLLLRPVLDRVDALPEPQAAALKFAFGMVPGGEGRFGGEPDGTGTSGAGRGGHDQLLVGLAVLSLLAELAADGPLLCLVDDAHWVDHASARALLFAARRFQAEGIALVFGARDGFDPAGLPELRLTGLEPADSQRLLEEHFPGLAGPLRRRVVEESAGNPLALLELPRTAAGTRAHGPEPLPLPDRIQRAYSARIAELPEQTRTALLVAAADDGGDPAAVMGAAGLLGAGHDALGAAERAGLVRVTAGRVAFVHPLVRGASFGTGTFEQRLAAHRALAEVLRDQPDRRAWHLAAAATGPDEEAALALERAAARARGLGGHAGTAAALERSAELTRDPALRARRLAAAAEAAADAGLAQRARDLTEAAARTGPGDPDTVARLYRLRARAAFDEGAPAAAHDLLLAAAEALTGPEAGARAGHDGAAPPANHRPGKSSGSGSGDTDAPAHDGDGAVTPDAAGDGTGRTDTPARNGDAAPSANTPPGNRTSAGARTEGTDAAARDRDRVTAPVGDAVAIGTPSANATSTEAETGGTGAPACDRDGATAPTGDAEGARDADAPSGTDTRSGSPGGDGARVEAGLVLVDAARNAWQRSDVRRLREAADRLHTLGLRPKDGLGPAVAAVTGAAVFLEHGPAHALPTMRGLVAAGLRDGAGTPALRVNAAFVAALVGDFEAGREISAAVAADCRARGDIGWLPLAHLTLAASQLYLGRFRDAEATAVEGLRLTADTGQPHRAGYLEGMLAWILAVRGETGRCAELAARCHDHYDATGIANSLAWSQWALALADLGQGRFAECLERLDAAEAGPVRHQIQSVYFAADRIEAAARLGVPAGDAQARFEEWARASGLEWAEAVRLRCRAQLESDWTEAQGMFRAAVRLHADSGRPWEAARTRLLFGERLRRERHKMEARSHLRAALETFQRLGAVPWAERARSELRAAGDTGPVEARGDLLSGLSPQELQIVRLAATGMTNREIAAQMFLSPKTVSYHLYRAFPKLRVSSRAQLAGIDLTGA